MQLAWILFALSAAPAERAEAPDTVVVCPPQFAEALRPWVEYRRQQGHRFVFVPGTRSADEIRAAIREASRAGGLGSIVLVGDADPEMFRDLAVRQRCVPTHKAEARINIRWGSEPQIATDNWYADLDDDGVPELAVGRITADTSEELSRIVRKIVAYEESADWSSWRRRVNFVAGVGGFGAVADTVIDAAAKKLITDGLPAAYESTMTHASWRSPYCPDPRSFNGAVLRRLNEGCLFWVYIGHGQRRFLDSCCVPGSEYRILDTRDMANVRAASGAPIAVFLACYTGAFDDARDCLAEEMLRAEGGPVAVVSGSRVTMPYGMSLLGTALLDECFRQRRATVGEVLLRAKRRVAAEPAAASEQGAAGSLPNRRLIEAVAAAVSPAPNELPLERTEHLLLFNLIGDPLLRLRQPRALELQAPQYAAAGGDVEVTVISPLAGKCTLELVCRRDRFTFTPPARPHFDPADGALAAYDEVYDRANDGRFAARQMDVLPGATRAVLPVPREARGSCHVRAYVEGNEDFALGSADVYVRSAAAP
jgi:hypothetical protein